MKLFKDFDAVKFPEEHLMFITARGYLYYIYDPERDFWRKHRNAGNDHLTVQNYPDVSKEELTAAMHGKYPTKETDFMRMCQPWQLALEICRISSKRTTRNIWQTIRSTTQLIAFC